MGTYKQFTGNAVLAHLSGAITGSPTSFTVDSATGFPTGAGSVPFVVTVDRGTSTEEKILCSSQTSGVFQIQTRGWDGTTSQNHANGATVEHTLDADTLNDSQQHIHVSTRFDHDAQYARRDGGNAFTGAVSTAGLTGAVAASRYVGATASGAPVSGTFAVGDFVIDQTGTVWVCTTAGPPGTWKTVGMGANPAARMAANSALSIPSASETTVDVTQDYAQGGMTVSAHTITVPVAGIYKVSWGVSYSASPGNPLTAGGDFRGNVHVSFGAEKTAFASPATGGYVTCSGSDDVSLPANATLYLTALQQSGVTVSLINSQSWLSVSLVAR